jgi:hypothetical protein
MPGLLPRSDRGWALVDRLHGRGLFERTVAGATSAAAVRVGASGAQVLPVDWDDQVRLRYTASSMVGAHVPGTYI